MTLVAKIEKYSAIINFYYICKLSNFSLNDMDQERNSAAQGEIAPALDVVGVVQKFKELYSSENHDELYEKADQLKALFYKLLNEEKSDASQERLVYLEGLEVEFKELYSAYRSERNTIAQDMERQKEENYAAKLQIIEDLKALLEKAEDVNHTFPAFRELQNRWKSIDMVPQSKVKDLWETYQYHVEKFYDYIKINNEFRDMDFRKNLEAKQALCSKAEALAQEENVVSAFKELQKLHDEWKELGPVAKEHRESVWERFKSATTVVNKKHQAYFENLKEEQKNNLEAKVLLCEKAEEIAAENPVESNGWNVLSKKMDQLQESWKGIGFASRKENQKVYDRFRAACDKFYNAKREYYANFKNVMQDNLKLKEKLCEQAEALMESDDWKRATDQLIALQKQWKEIGPVARKQSDAVWKRFRSACDHFFDNKSRHFGKIDEQYGENLAMKQALIEEVKNYRIGDTREDDIRALRSFQNRWSEIGFVPFKDKERIQNEFNQALDVHFADLRSLDSEKKLDKFRKMVSEVKNSGKGGRGLRMEREKLLQKYRKIEQDIATLENNMGFFAKSKSADNMIADIQKKIHLLKDDLLKIEEKINIIDNQFE